MSPQDALNFAGVGWILLQRRLARLGQEVSSEAIDTLLDLYDLHTTGEEEPALPGKGVRKANFGVIVLW